MAYLEFIQGIPQVKIERSVAYVDHNTLQSGFEKFDAQDKYIQTVAKKHGEYFSRPQRHSPTDHYERFGIPGKTLIDPDSHTPTGGGPECWRDGVLVADVAAAMGGGELTTSPCLDDFRGTNRELQRHDIILRFCAVKGGVGATSNTVARVLLSRS